MIMTNITFAVSHLHQLLSHDGWGMWATACKIKQAPCRNLQTEC